MLRITSRKDGIDPVVIALILGMVTVGEVAWAVNGMALPLRISLKCRLARAMLRRIDYIRAVDIVRLSSLYACTGYIMIDWW